MRSAKLLALLATGCLFAPSASAQTDGDRIGVPVTFYASANGRAAYGEMFSFWASSSGFVPKSPTDATGSWFGDYQEVFQYSWGNQTLSTAGDTVRLIPGRVYLANVGAYGDGGVVNWTKLQGIVPAGYALEIDNVRRSLLQVNGAEHNYVVRLVAASPVFIGRSAGAAGRSTGLSDGVSRPGSHVQVEWNAGLGSLRNGESAGSLSISDPGHASSWAALFTPAGLAYDSLVDEIQVYRESNNIRQIVAHEAVVDVVTINSTSYEVRFYNPADASTGGWPRTFSGSPFIAYKIEMGATLTALKITSTTPTRTAVTSLERSGTWPTFTWTTKDWNTSGQAQLTEQVRQNTTGSADRNEQVLVRVPSGATAIEAKNGYTFHSWGEELTSRTLGTTSPATTTYAFYDNPGDTANHRQLKSVVLPGGGWEAYEYWDPTGQPGRIGALKRRFRPWVDAPSTVTLDASQGEVTYFEYEADPFGMHTRSTLVETRVNNVLTSKTTTSYSNVSGTTNGMNLVQSVRTDYAASASTLATTTRFYREDVADAFFRSRVHSVAAPGGIRISYARQRGTWNGSAFTKTGSDGLGAGTASRIAVIRGTASTGTLLQTYDGYDIEDLYLVTGQSTMEATIRDSRALVVRTETHVWSGSAWALVGWTAFAYNTAGKLTSRTSSNGALHEIGWTGELKTSETDEAGTVHNYAYDHAGRLKEIAKVDGPTTEFTYDAAGAVTGEQLRRTGTGETITVARAFDDAGRLTSETPPGLNATTFGYNPTARTRTATAPDGGTRTETFLPDGRLGSITGSAVVSQFFSYAIETDGRRRTQANTASATSNRWAKTWDDWLGRTIQEDVPVWGGSTATRAHTYDSAGRLWKTTQPGLAPTLRTYDSMGNPATAGLDINSNNTLDANSDDRVRVYSTTIYDSGSGTWWLRQTESTYPIANNTTLKEVGRIETKLTNLGTNRLSHTESFDIHGNKTVGYTEVNRSTKTLTSTVDTPDSTTNGHRIFVNGLLTQTKDTVGVTTNLTYDLLGRPSTSTNPRTNGATTTTYVTNTARTETVKDPANVVQATYAYDTTGRVVSVKNADTGNKFAYFAYNTRGQKTHEWGHTTYPVEYAYDSYGQQTGMTTYATSTAGFTSSTWPTSPNNAQTTTWTYHEATGLLERKIDANSKSVDYTYTSAGQMAERKWARLIPNTSTRVATTYTYSSTTGELTDIDYNDSTPEITYTYNRLGAVDTVADYTSIDTSPRSFTYNLAGTLELQREDLPTFYWSRRLTYEYDTTTSGALGRPTAFKLGIGTNPTLDQNVSYTYQADGRLIGVNSNLGNGTFAYTYEGSSHLINKTENTTLGYKDQRTYDGAHDWLDARETTWGNSPAVTKAKFAYNQDDLGRVTEVAKTGTMFNRYGNGTEGLTTYYGYDSKSQLTSDVTKVGTGGTILAGRNDETLSYDNLGNRTSVTHNGNTSTYSVNSLNQYSQRTGTGVVDLAGAAGAASTVYANGVAPSRHGEYFFKNFHANGTASPRMIMSVVGVTPKVKSLNGIYGFNWPYQPVSTPTVTGPNGSSVQVLEFGGSANHVGMEKIDDNWPPGFNYEFQNGCTYVFGFWVRTTSGTRTITPVMTDNINDGVTSVTHDIDTSWKWVTVTKTYSNVGSNPRLFYTWDGGGTAFQVYGAKIADVTNPLDAATVTGFTPGASESFTYDDDGNLKTDGRWGYWYDAENRPIWIQARSEAVAAGHPNIAFHILYDYLGRRVIKHPYRWEGGTWVTDGAQERYLYNGWNLVARIENGSFSKTFYWGMDLAGPGQRAGGIGGLLMIKDGSNTYVPAYDALGNLHALMTTASVTLGGTNYSAGDIVASYEYDAFGQTLRESGPYAASNPFRFSTKYTDNDTGLVYFGLRYYSPSLGRFINRDPIGESGGLNLYGYVGNRAANAFDYLGMSPRPDAIANDMNIPKDPEWYDLYGNFGVDGTMPSSAPVVNANFTGLADRMGTFTGMGYLTFYLYAFASELRISFGELVGAIAKENAQARDREKLVRLADYTVRLNTRTGTATGSINGRVVSYEFKSGYGAVLDQMTGQWVRYASNCGTTQHPADQGIWAGAGAAALDSGGRYTGAVVEAFKFWKWPQGIADFAGGHLASAIYDSGEYFDPLSKTNVDYVKWQFGTAEGFGSLAGAGLVGAVAPQVPNVRVPHIEVPVQTRILTAQILSVLEDGTVLGRLPNPRTATAPAPPPAIIQVIDPKPAVGAGASGTGKHP